MRKMKTTSSWTSHSKEKLNYPFLKKCKLYSMYQSNIILTNYNIIVLLPQLSEWHKVANNKEQEEV